MPANARRRIVPQRPVGREEGLSRRYGRWLIVGAAVVTGLAIAPAAVLTGSGGTGGSDAAAAVAFLRPTARDAMPVMRANAALRRGLGSGNAVTLAFGGDVHFEGSIRGQLDASPARLLEEIAPVLSRADIAMVNLETSVTDRGDPAAKQYVFRAP